MNGTTIRSLLALTALLASAPVRAGECKPVYGFYTSNPIPCAAPLCTAGDLIGGIQASYEFTATALVPANDPTMPGVSFYLGRSVVAPLRGDALVFASDSGVVDLGVTGKQAALLTITGGTGAYEGARGYLLLRGTLDLAAGVVSGDYSGEICTP